VEVIGAWGLPITKGRSGPARPVAPAAEGTLSDLDDDIPF
jgi:hypothetical protein